MAASKDNKGASRQEKKAKKRKAEDAIPDVPEDTDSPNNPEIVKKRKRNDEPEVDVEKQSKADKRVKKDKQPIDGDQEDIKNQITTTDTAAEGEELPRKSKKERKAERKAKEAAEKAATTSTKSEDPSSKLAAEKTETLVKTTVTTSAPSTTTPASEIQKPKNNRNRAKKREAAALALANGEKAAPRFIVFIGNLPFSATKASIASHFASVKPKSVRHLTQKEDPTKSKGCAFLEFEGYDHMKTCLKLFHHSEFNDGISPPRQINVELSAGGGGNTKVRKVKIGEKNAKLNEERANRAKEEAKTKLVKKAGALDSSAVHPSRLSYVPDV